MASGWCTDLGEVPSPVRARMARYYPSKLKSQVKDSCPEAQCPLVQSRHGPSETRYGYFLQF